ncbi:hypothetical protein OJAG_12910 [Oerskovia enterophila]|uniref:Uncharacterized protein n=1 Tax=Oerskovia enterophila TaxID=43678 RepID=A0A161XGY9_9CELL|nr:hypothetical protein OJAG_12910 [Oerskovia enterophila]
MQHTLAMSRGDRGQHRRRAGVRALSVRACRAHRAGRAAARGDRSPVEDGRVERGPGLAHQGQGRPGVDGTVVGRARREGADQHVELGGEPRFDVGGRRHVGVDVLEGDLQRGLARVGKAAREHLVGHDTDRVHVRPCVAAARRDQLGAEVGDRAEDGAGRGRRGLRHSARETEVRDLDVPRRVDQDVLRLDVAVDQALAVGRGQGVQDLLEQLEGAAHGQRALVLQDVAERRARYVLHGQVAGLAVDPLVVDGDHARVGQARRGPRLAPEARDELRAVRALGQVRVHDFERDLAVESSVQRQVHRGHAATGDLGHDLVPPVDQAADERISRHSCHVGSLGVLGRGTGEAPHRGGGGRADGS